MKHIEEIEKHLPSNTKTLLYALREENWSVTGVEDSSNEWYLDQTWIIQSERECKGFMLKLWFCRYEGEFDEMDRVIATEADVERVSPYGDLPSIDFGKKKFESQLKQFLATMDDFRIG